MEQVTRTIYGSYIQTCLLLDVPPQYPQNSTLNEKFGIQSGVLPTSTERPHLGYYTVGNKGHTGAVGVGGVLKHQTVQHRATDAALYNHLPFVLRPLTNDLTAVARAKYGLRRVEVHGGVQYAAYYLRRVAMTGITPTMNLVVINGNDRQEAPFVPNSSNLNPTPPDINNTGVNVTDGQYVVASAILPLTISADEASELLNVSRILYDGDEGYAIISEIGLCTGVDKVVEITGPSGTFNMNEAIGVQIAAHVPALISLPSANEGATINLSVGATEPMFALSAE